MERIKFLFNIKVEFIFHFFQGSTRDYDSNYDDIFIVKRR